MIAACTPEKIAFKTRTPTWCRTKAREVGPACVEVIAGLLEVNALFRLRAGQGGLGLIGKHGAERLEKACARAIEVGDPSYRTIKGILIAGAESAPAPEPAGDGRAPAGPFAACSATSWPCPGRAASPPRTQPARAALTPAPVTASRPPQTDPAVPSTTSSSWPSSSPPPAR